MYKPSSVPLVPGDLIAVAYTNRFMLAVFVRYGGQGNTHYYPIEWMGENADRLEAEPDNRFPTVWFINTDADQRVVKITEESLTDKQKVLADKTRKLLVKKGKIK